MLLTVWWGVVTHSQTYRYSAIFPNVSAGAWAFHQSSVSFSPIVAIRQQLKLAFNQFLAIKHYQTVRLKGDSVLRQLL